MTVISRVEDMMETVRTVRRLVEISLVLARRREDEYRETPTGVLKAG